MPTLSKQAFDKVFVGIASIQLAPTGVLAITTFDNADEIFTVKDSVSFSQGQPTKTEILVDQFSAPIAATYEAGEFTITGNIPSVAKEILEYFFEKNAATPPVITGFTSGTAIDLTNKVINAMMKITSQDRQLAVVIPNCEFICNINWDTTSSSPMAVQFTATPKINPNGTGDVLFFEK